jgi:acetyl-CoA acetyltransferase
VGGVESMSRAPWVLLKPAYAYARGAPEIADTVLGWRFPNPAFPEEWTMGLGETAEEVAREFGVSREAQDAFAAESQRRADRAAREGRFQREIVPWRSLGGGANRSRSWKDEHPRPDTTPEDLARLRPVFRPNGTVTAGQCVGDQ